MIFKITACQICVLGRLVYVLYDYIPDRLFACSKILCSLLFVISERETKCPFIRCCAALWLNFCCEREQSAVITIIHATHACHTSNHCVGYYFLLAAVGKSWEQFSNRTAFCFLMFMCSSRKHAKTCAVVMECACVLALTRAFASFPVLMRRPSLRKPSKKA